MGTHSKWTPYRAAPGGPSPPYLTSLRSLSVRGHQAPSPKQKAGPTPAGAPNRRSRPHLPLREGPLSRSAPGAVPHSVRGRGRNPAANHVGPGPHRGAQVRLRPPLRAAAAPRSLRPRRPLLRCSPARGAPRHSAPLPRPPAGRATASSPSRTARDTQGPAPGGQDRTSATPPATALAALRSAHRTARHNASRHRCKVGPSGADPSSVRNARLRGHAPYIILNANTKSDISTLLTHY
ncbi:hypothetical protein NDU88_011090 [Pleurodeles waltl]|uniref:Uncharacterized protein n=1 Tax=Pleurodeles waltl TaxID=8319 RepID=A0AAV7QXT9_PLEWA|nr:hypothetical protein NDU88_011090 [Pleurodeles waltl]